MANEVEQEEPHKPEFQSNGEVKEEEDEVGGVTRKKRKKRTKKSVSTTDRNKDFILDGVAVESQKRFGKYDQMIDVHLIRFFEKEITLNSMQSNGLIDKKGKLLDNIRARQIRKTEIELNVIPSLYISRFKDFNIKKKLRE
jgi:hypothetical protein